MINGESQQIGRSGHAYHISKPSELLKASQHHAVPFSFEFNKTFKYPVTVLVVYHFAFNIEAVFYRI